MRRSLVGGILGAMVFLSACATPAAPLQTDVPTSMTTTWQTTLPTNVGTLPPVTVAGTINPPSTTLTTTTTPTPAKATTAATTPTQTTTVTTTTANTTTATTTTTTTTPTTATTTTTTTADPYAYAAGAVAQLVDPALYGVGQILLITTENTTTSYCHITFLQKKGDRWEAVWQTPGRVGSKGIVPREERLQDTYKTPSGILKITGAYGIAADPGAKFDYLRVTDHMYWDLNSGSPTYNRLVYADKRPAGDLEHLISYTKSYRYGLFTDYNVEQTPGKGGAIFIHCNGNGATAGCISMPEEQMKALLCAVDPAQNPVAVLATVGDLSRFLILR